MVEVKKRNTDYISTAVANANCVCSQHKTMRLAHTHAQTETDREFYKFSPEVTAGHVRMSSSFLLFA